MLRFRFESRIFFIYFDLYLKTQYLIRNLDYSIKKKSQSFPSIFQIQTTNICNGSCIMCPNSIKTKGKMEPMGKKLFEKIIKEINNETEYALIALDLQNEPLLDKKIFEKIRLIKKLSKGRITTGFFTNGSLFSDKKIKELVKSGNDFLIFSLDAISEKTYNKIRKGLNFNNTLENIDKILNSGYGNHIAVSFVIQKDNIEEYKTFKKFWCKRNIATVINDISNRSGDLINYNDIKFKQRNSTIKKYKRKISKSIIKVCPIPLTTFNILSNGDVILCCNDFNKKFILGNIQNSTIKEIWNNKKYQIIRDLFYRKDYNKIPGCNNCSFWI